MSGIKGKSGRKSWKKEIQVREIWELSYSIIRKALVSEEIPEKDKIQIAREMLSKMLPREIKAEGLETHFINVIRTDLLKQTEARDKLPPQEIPR